MKDLFQDTHYIALIVFILLIFIGFKMSFLAGLGMILIAFIYSTIFLD